MDLMKRFQALLISLDCDGLHLRHLGGFSLKEGFKASMAAEWEEEDEYEDGSGGSNVFEMSMVVDIEKCTVTIIETKTRVYTPETGVRVWEDLTGSAEPAFTSRMLDEIPWRTAVISKMISLCEKGSELSREDQSKFDMYSAQLRGGMRVATSDDEKNAH